MGAVPGAKPFKLPSSLSSSKTSRNSDHKRCMSQSFGPDDVLPNDAKNQIMVEGLYGNNRNDEIDRIMGDDNITQRHKEEFLFDMLDQINLEGEEEGESGGEQEFEGENN